MSAYRNLVDGFLHLLGVNVERQGHAGVEQIASVRSASRTTATTAAQARLRVAQQRARFGRGLLDTHEPFLPGRSIVDRVAGDTAPNTVVRKQVAFIPNPKSFARAGLRRWATREKFRNVINRHESA
jgi:hypothetical protein